MQSGDPLKRLTQRLGLSGARVPLFAVGVLAAIIPPLLLVLL